MSPARAPPAGAGSGTGTTWVVRRPGASGPRARIASSGDPGAPRRVPRAASETPSRGRGAPGRGSAGILLSPCAFGAGVPLAWVFLLRHHRVQQLQESPLGPKARRCPRPTRLASVASPRQGFVGPFLGRGGLLVEVECPSCWVGGSLWIPLSQKGRFARVQGKSRTGQWRRAGTALPFGSVTARLSPSRGQTSSCVPTRTVAEHFCERAGPIDRDVGRGVGRGGPGKEILESVRPNLRRQYF